MLRFAYFTPFRYRAAWLLALGLLAVTLHALAGTGLMRASLMSVTSVTAGNGDKFVADVCTSHGVVNADSAQSSSDGSQQDTAAHDCCKLCAAGGPLLAAAVEIAVPPAPTFAGPRDSHTPARPTLAVRTAHPPRGPPEPA